MTTPDSESRSGAVRKTDEPLPETDARARDRVETSLRRLDRFAGLLDDDFRIPGTDIRFGIDPLIGVLPGGGDWVAWVAGVYVIWEGGRLRLPTRKMVAMAGHSLIDLLGGYIPVVGDLFDLAYRSNRRNVEIVFDHFDYRERGGGRRELPDDLPQSPTRPWKVYATVVLLIVGLTILAVAPIALLWWLFGG